MRRRALALFQDGGWQIVIGFSCLWACVQSSSFYPLSLAAFGPEGESLVVTVHLVWCVTVIALACGVASLAERLVATSRRLRLLSIGALVCGVASHLLLSSVYLIPGVSLLIPCAAAMMNAAFVVLAFEALAVQVSTRVDDAYMLLLVAFMLSQCLKAACLVFETASHVLLLAYCALGAAVPLLLMRLPDQAGRHPRARAALRSETVAMLVISLLFLYFIIIFMRFQFDSFPGDSGSAPKILSALFALVMAGIAMVVARRSAGGRDALPLSVFVLFVGLSILSMALILAFPTGSDASAVFIRMLVSASQCLGLFVWMQAAGNSRGDSVFMLRVFSVLVVLVEALPWMLSFDMHYLSGLDGSVAWDSILRPVIALVLALVSIGVIALLYSSLRRQAQRAPRAEEAIAEAVEKATRDAGLTKAELEIATYVYRGYTSRAIAECLSYADSTVRTYTTRIYKKLGVSSKQELIEYVEGYID